MVHPRDEVWVVGGLLVIHTSVGVASCFLSAFPSFGIQAPRWPARFVASCVNISYV